MGKRSGPRHGSLAFHPRKRAVRIYPSMAAVPASEKPGLSAFAAYKAGMTHVVAQDNFDKSPSYGQQVVLPCTVLECPSLVLFGVRAYEKTVYGPRSFGEIWTEKLSKDLARTIILPKKQDASKKTRIEKALAEGRICEVRALVHTQPRATKLKKRPEVFELPVNGKPSEAWAWALERLGKELQAADFFKEGEFIDLIAITTGKGTTGPVKRFGIKIQIPKAAPHRRRPGCIGQWHPAGVRWTVAQAGQQGFQQRTEYNKRVLKIGADGATVTPAGGFVNYGPVNTGFVLVHGSVPGPRKRLILFRHALRGGKKTPMPAVLSISRTSQQ